MKSGTDAIQLPQVDRTGFNSLSTPTERGSTIIYPDYLSYRDRGKIPRSGYSYGLTGTPTTRVLQAKLTELENGAETFLTPSGLMAITVSILAICESGDQIFLPDNVYPPVRRFAKDTLEKFGIKVNFYDPSCPEIILNKASTAKVIWVESPGSMTMEITDFSLIRQHADRLGAIVGCDNSWGSPHLCRPLDQGADLVVEAVTKYLSGHSDVLMGSITVGKSALADKIHKCIRSIGVGVSPDDCFLVLRGMETAALRIAQVGNTALKLAQAVANNPAVEAVLHPALTVTDAHKLWKRQFGGSSGLFTIVLKGDESFDFEPMLENLTLFSIGASWGGTHSILSPGILDTERVLSRKYCQKPLLRVSAGLENPEDLLSEFIRALRSINGPALG